MNTTSIAVVKLSVEVITLPVSDVGERCGSMSTRSAYARRRLFAERRSASCSSPAGL
jgi:hypothetical protein